MQTNSVDRIVEISTSGNRMSCIPDYIYALRLQCQLDIRTVLNLTELHTALNQVNLSFGHVSWGFIRTQRTTCRCAPTPTRASASGDHQLQRPQRRQRRQLFLHQYNMERRIIPGRMWAPLQAVTVSNLSVIFLRL